MTITDIGIEHRPESEEVVLTDGPALWLIMKLVADEVDRVDEGERRSIPGCTCPVCARRDIVKKLLISITHELTRADAQFTRINNGSTVATDRAESVRVAMDIINQAKEKTDGQ